MQPTWQTGDGSIRLWLGDCLAILPTLARDDIDAVITDPPYGCEKAEWDGQFFSEWYEPAKRFECPICTITGSQGVPDALRMVGNDYIDIIAARNLNGMTRGPIGFGNWLSCVVSCWKPRQGPNCFDFVVKGKKPDHPSPKPIEYMVKLVGRITAVGKTVCDPMMGSGSTGLACVRTNRRFIGIEKNPEYFELARNRIAAELSRFPLLETA